MGYSGWLKATSAICHISHPKHRQRSLQPSQSNHIATYRPVRISAVDTPFPYSAKSNAISLRHRKIERNFITEQYRTLPEPPELRDKQSRENIGFFRCKCDY